MHIIRQGDILLIPLDMVSRKIFNSKEAFESAQKVLNGKLTQSRGTTLAEGEATGHNHILEGDVIVMEDRSDVVVNERGQVVEVKSEARLVHTSGDHPDHDVLTIPAGKFLRVIQKQKDPFAGWKRVVD